MISTMSQTWWATASTAARATRAGSLSGSSWVSTPRTSRSQCGAPSPVKAGTRVTPPASSTVAASVSRSGTLVPSSRAAQASVAPDDKMLPSRAYVGVSVSQARVDGTGDEPATNDAVGVITDVPVP